MILPYEDVTYLIYIYIFIYIIVNELQTLKVTKATNFNCLLLKSIKQRNTTKITNGYQQMKSGNCYI